MSNRTGFNIGRIVLVAGFVFAAQVAFANQASTPANNNKIASESVKTGLLYLADTSRPTEEKVDPSDWRSTLRESLFPNINSSDYLENEMNTMALIPEIEASPYDQDGYFLMSDQDRDRLEMKARGEAYRVAADILLAIKPIAKLKEALEPFMRPIEVYEGNGGDITTKYFGMGETGDGNSVQVFTLNLGVSPSHSINVGMNFYRTVELSLFDGNRVELSYAPSASPHKIGISEKGLDQVLLVYGYRF